MKRFQKLHLIMIEVLTVKASGSVCALLFALCNDLSCAAPQCVGSSGARQTQNFPFMDFDTFQSFSFHKPWDYFGLVCIVLIKVWENECSSLCKMKKKS